MSTAVGHRILQPGETVGLFDLARAELRLSEVRLETTNQISVALVNGIDGEGARFPLARGEFITDAELYVRNTTSRPVPVTVAVIPR